MPSAVLGLDAARAVDPSAYGAPGRAPRFALRPASREEVAEAVRAAAHGGLTVIPFGGPADAALAAELPPFDLALDLAALDRVVEYEPEDLTVTAECGVTLEALRARLAARGQELPLESQGGGLATLGGALASNASGARRLKFGAPRDRVLGARFVLGDGTIARTGGKVVKNVAGYAIHRLLCGSRGGLAILIEASLKLVPRPERREALIYATTADRLRDAALWAEFPRLEPAALTVLAGAAARTVDASAFDEGFAGAAGAPGHAAAGPSAAPPVPGAARDPAGSPSAPFLVVLGFEDDAGWVEEQIERATARLGAPAARRTGAAVEALWQSLADAADPAGPRLTFTSSHNTPAALAAALDTPGDGFIFHAPAGRLHLFPGGDERRGAERLSGDRRRVPRASGPVHALVARLAGHGFTLIASRGVGESTPVLPPQQAVLALRARIRAELDSTGRFALGGRWERGAP